MPSFIKPFSNVTGRSSVSLFEIRLDNDFIVFRGSEHESAGQTLKGSVVLCLSSPLKVEDVHLRLTGELRFAWEYSKAPTAGLSNYRVDKHIQLLKHRWRPFVKGQNGEKRVLEAGNYEWPFKIDLAGDTPESVEGIPEASIVYRLKATIARGKLASDIQAYKPLRVIRTLETSALEFLHAMSVENIWPNKVDYSIVLPQKAVIFGASVPLEMRFTPLLKGLELGDITVKLMEIRECTTPSVPVKEHKEERDVSTWTFGVTREEHWRDTIGDTGQEGWELMKKLNLPKRLKQCVQDVNHHGIKIRHKLKLVIALKNPDGHISELRATLPISIFLSANIPMDEHGVIVENNAGTVTSEAETATMAPPGYGQHVLDQLFEDVDHSGLQTPGMQTPGFHTPGFQTPGIVSGVNSPLYSQSRAGSSENLAALGMTSAMNGVPPAALSSRLQNVSLEPSDRNDSDQALADMLNTPHSNPATSLPSQTASTALTRHNSSEDDANDHEHLHLNLRSGRASPGHVECIDMDALSKVPSYTTALKTPARQRATPGGTELLPDYFSALSTTSISTQVLSDNANANIDPLGVIHEGREVSGAPIDVSSAAATTAQPLEDASPPSSPIRFRSLSFRSGSHRRSSSGHAQGPEERRLHLIQARD